uniref:Uncharacterized protein n=1 Tax=Candidatus Kentrum sp. TUN TaxID=2126343 RepID=A0A450ZPW6_9GAMM|nr:MAG: hypothetical protein BECKTUN1418D_GA0071000_103812 [Candidatus Kentron sp. TUN]
MAWDLLPSGDAALALVGVGVHQGEPGQESLSEQNVALFLVGRDYGLVMGFDEGGLDGCLDRAAGPTEFFVLCE